MGAVDAAGQAADRRGSLYIRAEDRLVTPKPDPAPLLSALAAALAACDEAGLKVRLRHGGIIANRDGYVVRSGDGWVARTAAWTEFSPASDEEED